MHAAPDASTHHRANMDASPDMDTIAEADVDARRSSAHRNARCRAYDRAHYSVRRDTYCNRFVYAFADTYRCSNATGYGIAHADGGANCYSHQHSDTLSNANIVTYTYRNTGSVAYSN